MNISQRDIVLIEYPFSDFSGSKLRPAIILSNQPFNNFSDDCIAAPLTTVIKETPYSLLIRQNNLDSGEIIHMSRLRVDKLFSLEKRLIAKKLGTLNIATFEKVKTLFMQTVATKQKSKLHLHYDVETDILECRFGEPTEAYYEELGNEVLQRIDEKTGEVCGFMVMSFHKRAEKKPFDIDIPMTAAVLQKN